MNNIYSEIEKYAKKRNSFFESEEYEYFLSHRNLLERINKFSYLLNNPKDEFFVMRANIMLRGLENKKIIEEEIKSLGEQLITSGKVDHAKFIQTLRDRTLELPYFLEEKLKIYIPFFSRAINYIYIKEPEKLLEHPYKELFSNFDESMQDPFDLYSHQIYNSYFTRLVLIKVAPNGKEAAYFHYDTNTIYFVNDQGRLDRKIVLFDKYLKRVVTSHMLERIEPVVDAYFAFDRGSFIDSLYKSKFISSRMLNYLRKNS